MCGGVIKGPFQEAAAPQRLEHPPRHQNWALAAKGIPHPAPWGCGTWPGVLPSAPRAPSPGPQIPGGAPGHWEQSTARMTRPAGWEAHPHTASRACLLCPARTLPGGGIPAPAPASASRHDDLRGGTVVSRPCSPEGLRVLPPPPAFCPEGKRTKQAGHCPGWARLGSKETRQGRQWGSGHPRSALGGLSGGVGGPRHGHTQRADVPPRGLGEAPTPPPHSQGHPQVGSEVCTSLKGDIRLQAPHCTLCGTPPAPGTGPLWHLLPQTSWAGPRALGPLQGCLRPTVNPQPPST